MSAEPPASAPTRSTFASPTAWSKASTTGTVGCGDGWSDTRQEEGRYSRSCTAGFTRPIPR
jgi:hypothetical protein